MWNKTEYHILTKYKEATNCWSQVKNAELPVCYLCCTQFLRQLLDFLLLLDKMILDIDQGLLQLADCKTASRKTNGKFIEKRERM